MLEIYVSLSLQHFAFTDWLSSQTIMLTIGIICLYSSLMFGEVIPGLGARIVDLVNNVRRRQKTWKK